MKIEPFRRLLPTALLMGLVCPAIAQEQISADEGTRVIWQNIVGIVVPGGIVGRRGGDPGGDCEIGVTCVEGAPAPWAATGGSAEVNLDSGTLRFDVHGLALADDFNLTSIGTTSFLRRVRGTLVCNDAEPGFAELVDTTAVRLNAAGDATFSGHGTLPASCTDEPEDIVFVIRMADLSEFEDLVGTWVAFGSGRVIRR